METTVTEKIDSLSQIIWDYGTMQMKPEPSDVIVVFGSYNPIVTKRAAELYAQGYAPLIVFTGGRSDATLSWEKTEAETLADQALAAGVPKHAILLETQATNTGENIIFTRNLLEKHGIDVRKIIAIQKPYAERRMYAAIRKQWPEVEVIPTSPRITYSEYMESSPNGKVHSLKVMLGDLERIKTYPAKGFQIEQEIPENVWNAYEELKRLVA